MEFVENDVSKLNYYPLIQTVQEIVPNLGQTMIIELLKQNNFDIERSVDAALALAVNLEEDKGSSVANARNERGNLILQHPQPNTGSEDNYVLSLPPNYILSPRNRRSLDSQTRDNIVGEAKIVRAASYYNAKVDATNPSVSSKNSFSSVSSNGVSAFRTDADFHRVAIAAPAPSSSSSLQHKTSKPGLATSSRGTAMVLPTNFLAVPRFLFTCHCVSQYKIEFSVRYCRRDYKLGFTIQERNAVIEVVALQQQVKNSQELLLAKLSGVAVGDLLIGLNEERFGPWAELQDVMEILNLSGTYVTMHYLRRLQLEAVDVSLYPRRMKLLVENDVIKPDQVPIIDQTIDYLKDRVIKWSSEVLARKVEQWHLESIEVNDSPTNRQRRQSTATADPLSEHTNHNSSSSSASSFSSKSAATVRLDRRHTLDPRALEQQRLSSISANEEEEENHQTRTRYSQVETQNLRPALAVRVLRAELAKNQNYMVYVIWVLDVKSGVEWILRRRFREFFDFRDTVVSIRKKLQSLDFPLKTMAAVTENNAIVAERLVTLQRFLRRLAGLITINSHHPSTIKLHMALQRFLMVEDRLDMIILKESDPATHIAKTVEVFAHNILHLTVMDRVLHGFIDSFLSHQVEDVSRLWSHRDADQVIDELKKFLDHLQNFLCETLFDDCSDIVGAVLQNGVQLPAQASRLIERLTNPNDGSSTSSVNDTARKAEMCDILVQITTDEFRTVIRSAIRRQVETEIYLALCGRLKFILNQAMGDIDEQFAQRLYKLSVQPQSYYEIPLQHISPSSWEEVVSAFRVIGSQCTLPCDKIEMLLTASRSIFVLYRKEHPEASSALGADEILPIYIYVLTQAQIKNLILMNYELQMLCDEDKRMSEAGYYLATLQASITHILEADLLKEKPFSPPSRHSEDDEDE